MATRDKVRVKILRGVLAGLLGAPWEFAVVAAVTAAAGCCS